MTHIDSRNVIISLDISPESEPALKKIVGLHQFWRLITVYMVLTHEEIPEEGGKKDAMKILIR